MKAAIYCRLSEEDRNKQFETDDSNSIQNQENICQGDFHQKAKVPHKLKIANELYL